LPPSPPSPPLPPRHHSSSPSPIQVQPRLFSHGVRRPDHDLEGSFYIEHVVPLLLLLFSSSLSRLSSFTPFSSLSSLSFSFSISHALSVSGTFFYNLLVAPSPSASPLLLSCSSSFLPVSPSPSPSLLLLPPISSSDVLLYQCRDQDCFHW